MKKTRKEHRKRIWTTLRKLLKKELRIKFSKNEFKKEEVKFLEHVIKQEDIESDSKKIRILRKWLRLTKVKEV